jgi:hypothetical protein
MTINPDHAAVASGITFEARTPEQELHLAEAAAERRRVRAA